MIVVTVARKPLSEGSVAANVLVHAAGALNIDASRIGTSGGSTQPSGMDRLNAANAAQGYRPGSYQKGVPLPPPPGGRWPANMVFEHLDACMRVGTRKVRGVSGGGNGLAVSIFGSNVSKAREPGRIGFVDEDGLEVVDEWKCVEGCPVMELDAMSGEVRSAGSPKYADSKDTSFFSSGFGGAPGDGFYADKGGASRFFKQVGGQKS